MGRALRGLFHLACASTATLFVGGIDSTAQSSGGCAYVHPECSREPHAKFLQLWAEKTRCWLCDNQDLVNAAQGVLRDLLHTDRPTIRPMDQLSDNEAALDPIWQQTCLSSYLLALFSSTRSQVVQPWYFYELGLSIVHGCSYDEAVFFGHFEITPKQVAYTFYVLGLAYGMPSAMMNLQLPELGPQGLPEHGLPPMEEASLVFDIGMGLGADTRYFLSQGFRVVAVEANKKAIDVALGIEWVKPHVLSGRLTFLHAAIAPYGQGGGVTKIFALPQRPEQSNAQEWVEDAGGLPELVRTVECADLLRIFGKATYMKIDVESSTIDCLESIHSQVTNSSGSSERRPALPKFISLELEAASLKDRFHQLLRRLGYSSYKACRQYIYSPAPCEIGSYSDDVPGCGSGPFGDAAVDYLRGPKWTPIDELPNDGGFVEEFERGLDWFDIHAQLAGD